MTTKRGPAANVTGAAPSWVSRGRQALQGTWKRLRGAEVTPLRAALSVAVGLTIGVTPLYGFHLPLVLGVCVPLALDAPVAYLAANISIPIMSPLLLFAEVEIGAYVRTGHPALLSLAALRHDRGHALATLARELVVGTCVFAPLMGLLGFLVTHAVVSRIQRRKAQPSPFEAAVARVAARYARGRRAAYYYVRGKLAGDPVARAVVSAGPLGAVTDAGCGRGQLALLLLEAGAASSVRGFDWDATKVNDAREAGAAHEQARALEARFEQGDLRTHALEPSDTVLLIDVLHYLSDEEQDAVLARVAASARARVLVRELDPDRGWRSALTRLQERVTTSARYNRGERVRARSIAALALPLTRAGFSVRVEPCWGRLPLSNVLVFAERQGRDEDLRSHPREVRGGTPGNAPHVPGG